MKIRNGFVSNSSSSSFMIYKKDLTEKQIYWIKNHIAACHLSSFKKFSNLVSNHIREQDAWDIRNEDDKIIMSTIIDNFDMLLFLEYIGVDRNNIFEINYEGYYED